MRLAERYCGFTLTEVLMAVGILGIGLTMVASIFPVAVDQSRRSQDQTSAALCARSVAAMMRIRHSSVLTLLRPKGDEIMDGLREAFLLEPQVVYRPSWFLYRSDKPRSYDDVPLWSAGNYVARTFTARTSPSGPHRLTLAICRSGGQPPASAAAIKWTIYVNRYGVRPGMYAMDIQKKHVMGYLVEHVASNKTGYLTVGQVYDGTAAINDVSTGQDTWRVVPDAVAIYHSYLGE